MEIRKYHGRATDGRRSGDGLTGVGARDTCVSKNIMNLVHKKDPLVLGEFFDDENHLLVVYFKILLDTLTYCTLSVEFQI